VGSIGYDKRCVSFWEGLLSCLDRGDLGEIREAIAVRLERARLRVASPCSVPRIREYEGKVSDYPVQLVSEVNMKARKTEGPSGI
jgi:hypothetical protein